MKYYLSFYIFQPLKNVQAILSLSIVQKWIVQKKFVPWNIVYCDLATTLNLVHLTLVHYLITVDTSTGIS